MTHATGEYASILSGRGIQIVRAAPTGDRAARQLLSDEPKPLVFEVTGTNGESFTVSMLGSGHEPTSFWRILKMLTQLSTLPAGWDSYGAQPLSLQAIRRCFSVLPLLLEDGRSEPEVMPTREGGIQFEWHINGVDFEVAVPPSLDDPISYLFVDDNSGEEQEGALDDQVAHLAFARMASAA